MRRLCLLVSLAACNTYVNHRTAIVPHASPVTWDGQPVATSGQVSIGADTLVDLVKPTAGDSTQANQVPQHQGRGMLTGRINDRVALSAIYQRAVTNNTTVLSDTAPRLTDASLTGYGAAMKIAIPTETPGLRVGLAFEAVVWSVPWAQFSTCSSDLDGCGHVASDRSDLVPTLGVGLVPSYRDGRMTYFGGASIRNQPTISEVTVTEGAPDSSGPDTGPATITFMAGAGVDVGHGVHANAFVHQTIGGPIDYGPSVGFEVAIPLGRTHAN